MERKRIEKLVALLLVGILIPVSLFPFRINADTITSSNINGISVTLDEVTFIEYKQFTIDGVNTNVARNYYNYIAEIQFDKSYLGNININMQYSYQARNDTGMVTFNGTKLQKVFVNGDKAYMSFGFVANSNTDPLWYNSITYTLTNSDVIEYGLISDIQQIVDILEDNQDIIEDIYSELGTVVANTSLANTYLDKLLKMKEYDLPFESVPFVYYQYYQGLTPLNLPNDTDHYDNYIFFKAPANQKIGSITTFPSGNRSSVTLVIGTNVNVLASNFYNYFGVDSNIFDVSVELLGLHYTGFRSYYINKIIISRKSGSSGQIYVDLVTSETMYIMPIYLNYSYVKSISTDFALKYGLSNRLLDDLDIIANGTTQSSSSSGSLDQATSQFSDDANDLVTIEESFNNSMNQSLQNVNPTFNMGSSFLTSANWVSQQFNRIVNNTPFASLITFGLTLGLGLLIIGKVRK